MTKTLILAAVLFVSAHACAQFYVSAGAGYSIAIPDAVLGISTVQTSTTAITKTNNYGSLGTGMNYKLNLGYFLNKNLGIDLGLTLLKGPTQTLDTYLYGVAGIDVSSKATATAIGFAPSLVYKLDNGLYGRLGLATKIGGQTVVDIYNKAPRDANTYTVTTAKAVVNGKIPVGVTSALGYSCNVNKNIAIFGEVEFLGISVKRDKLAYSQFDTSVYLNNGTLAQAAFYTIDNLPPGYVKETTYGEEYTGVAATGLTTVSLYSSVGLNIGVKYSF